MIRRPPRSTLFPYTNALPISEKIRDRHRVFVFPIEHSYLLRLRAGREERLDRKSTRLNSSHQIISYAVFCLKKKKTPRPTQVQREQQQQHRKQEDDGRTDPSP